MSIFRRGLMMATKASKPYDVEVEYIESDGYAYIDTGIKVASTITFDMNIYIPELTVNKSLFGGRVAYNDRQMCAMVDTTTTTKYISWRYGNTFGVESTIPYSSGDWHFSNIEASRKLVANTYSVTLVASTFSTDYTFYICAWNSAGTATSSVSGMKIYDCKLYSNGTLVRDFIPVRVGQVGYLYDKVSKQLFGNARDIGAFTFGNDK